MDLILKKYLWQQYYINKKRNKDILEFSPLETGCQTYYGKSIHGNDITCVVATIIEIELKIQYDEFVKILPEEIEMFCKDFTFVKHIEFKNNESEIIFLDLVVTKNVS